MVELTLHRFLIVPNIFRLRYIKFKVKQCRSDVCIVTNGGVCVSVGRPKHVRVMAGALEGEYFVGPTAEVFPQCRVISLISFCRTV